MTMLPSIKTLLQEVGIDCVVDGDEMNPASFTVWTYSPRDVVEQTLMADGIGLEQ